MQVSPAADAGVVSHEAMQTPERSSSPDQACSSRVPNLPPINTTPASYVVTSSDVGGSDANVDRQGEEPGTPSSNRDGGTIVRTASARWRLVRKQLRKVITTQKPGWTPSSSLSDWTTEKGLRDIISQFQTRRLEPMRKTSHMESTQEAAEEEKNLRRWTSGLKSIADSAANSSWFHRYVRPLLHWVTFLLLCNQTINWPILFAFVPTDMWLFTTQVALEVALMLDGITSLIMWYSERKFDSSRMTKEELNRRRWLLVDMLCILPLSCILGHQTCRSARFSCSLPANVKLIKLPFMWTKSRMMIYTSLESGTSRKVFMNMWKLLTVLLVPVAAITLITCLWYIVSTASEDPEVNWFRALHDEAGTSYDSDTRTERFWMAFYYSLLMLVGDGITPRSMNQHIFAAFMLIFGTFCEALIIGEAATLVSRATAAKASYELKMENMDFMMSYLKLPKMLQERVREYYAFLWEEHRCIDGDPTPFVRELSPAIRAEVDLFLKRALITKSDLFRSAPVEFVRDLSAHLELVFYLRGDFVVREGEAGHSMYFISRGVLRVSIKDRFIKDLEEGDCFGEIAVMRPSSKRSASVYAHSHCTLYSLDRSGVNQLMLLHPGVLDAAIAAHYSSASPEGKRASLVFGRRQSLEDFTNTLSQKGHVLAGQAVVSLDDGYRKSALRKSAIQQPRTAGASPDTLAIPVKMVLRALGIESHEQHFVQLGVRELSDILHLEHDDLPGVPLVTFRKLIKLVRDDDEVSD